MAIEKIKILGAVLELQAKHCLVNSTADLANLAQFWGKYKYMSYVKSIATYAPTFFGYIILVLAMVKLEKNYF